MLVTRLAGRPACCEPEAATWRATASGPGRAQRSRERTQACRERAGWPAAGRIIPADPPAQRLPGEPDELIGTDRQSRRARPGPLAHRSGDRELSHFLAVAIHRELASLAAGTDAEVVDLVGVAVVLEGGDGRAAAGVVFCGPQGQTFLTLAPAGLRGGSHRSVFSRPDSGHLA